VVTVASTVDLTVTLKLADLDPGAIVTLPTSDVELASVVIVNTLVSVAILGINKVAAALIPGFTEVGRNLICPIPGGALHSVNHI